MTPIPPEPVAAVVAGLTAIATLALALPLMSRKVEENLEPFFLVLGAAAVTVSGLWSPPLVFEALKAPVMIGSLPLGIFQVVLVVGILIHYLNKPFCAAVLRLVHTLGPRAFVFALMAVFGLLSSVISVILTACLLSEIIAGLPMAKGDKVRLIVAACFAAGLGACLTPLGEPLSTILVSKLSGPPLYAGFFFPLRHLGIYLIPGVLGLAFLSAVKLGPKISIHGHEHVVEYPETLGTVVLRAVKVFVFIAALVLLGEGFKPLIVWYFAGIPPGALYWLNSVSAVLDNATLTAIEIGPSMALPQIVSIVMGLSIAGGMLIPGNIPNIVAAGRMKIGMKQWAQVGIPVGLAIMAVYYVILFVF
jgi:predicted cation transporter